MNINNFLNMQPIRHACGIRQKAHTFYTLSPLPLIYIGVNVCCVCVCVPTPLVQPALFPVAQSSRVRWSIGHWL